MTLQCEYRYISTDEQREKKISHVYYRIDNIHIFKNFEILPSIKMIENLITGYGTNYRMFEREYGSKEIVTVKFSDRALEQLQAMGGDNV
jgi:hypothetical protein